MAATDEEVRALQAQLEAARWAQRNTESIAEACRQEARFWAMEARTHRSVVRELASMLGVPSWGPIVQRVRSLLQVAQLVDEMDAALAPVETADDLVDPEALRVARDRLSEIARSRGWLDENEDPNPEGKPDVRNDS